jgi:hypothetical protein
MQTRTAAMAAPTGIDQGLDPIRYRRDTAMRQRPDHATRNDCRVRAHAVAGARGAAS